MHAKFGWVCLAVIACDTRVLEGFALHDAHKELKPISCNAQALVMHVTCKTIVTIVGQTHSHLGFSKCARRCHTDIGFKRSLLAFAEREKGEQPWSADQANQRWGHTPY